MALSKEKMNFLEKKAYNIRKHIIEACINHGDGHAGSSLSCTDILAVLYMDIMKLDVDNPKSKDRDYFILSAGHKCLALYGTLVEKGFESASIMDTYNQLDTPIPGHPDRDKFRGVDFSTGSLGHGLPLACGLAKGLKLRNQSNKVYVLMGDGEQGEGSIWEAAAYASHNKLDNIIAFIDKNGLQINGTTKDVLNTNSLKERYEAFGWEVKEINGHDVKEIHETVSSAPFTQGKPSLIIANTVKGKGLSFAENNLSYHHWDPGEEEANIAREELSKIGKRWHSE
ncbi:MAG: transketolase [Clostridiales bacterium]|nr:transketolase [Clostridiales bacterium]